MCIIVDANVANDLCNGTEDSAPVLKWLLTGGGALIIGGKLTGELFRTKLRDTLVVLDRAGRLRRVDSVRIEEVESKLDKDSCRSDDLHIIATAVVSGCRLVYTRDQNLQKDMKNKKVVDPVASIYTKRSHRHLLHPCECKI